MSNKILIGIILVMAAFGFLHWRSMQKEKQRKLDFSNMSQEEIIEKILIKNQEFIHQLQNEFAQRQEPLSFDFLKNKTKEELADLLGLCTCSFGDRFRRMING